VGQDLGHNFGAGNHGLADLDLGVLCDQENVGDLGGGTGFARKAFHLKSIAFANLVLFSTCPDDGEGRHKFKIVS
jgi:hypothetical protein